MNLLITGGAGFIGSEFVSQIASDSSVNITVLDSLTYAGDKKNLATTLDKIDFFEIVIETSLS